MKTVDLLKCIALRPALVALTVGTLSIAVYAQAPARAQAHQPGPLRSEPAAVLQYEAGQLRTLQERCRKEQTDGWEQWERAGAISGWVLQARQAGKPGQSAAYARVDLDKRMAHWVDHQGLDGSQRLHLKLALPRDYARCRVVMGAQGQLRLEVAHQATLLDARVKELFVQMSTAQADTSCGTRDRALVVFRSGEGAAWPLCTDAQKMLATQARHLTYELLGEDPQAR